MTAPDQAAFEAWAQKHGDLPLEKVGDATSDACICEDCLYTSDKKWALPTYKDSHTEIAWRAWASDKQVEG